MRALVPISAAIALVACGASTAAVTHSSAAASRSAKPPCGPARAKTLAADSYARVYESGSAVYGCASGGRSYRLGAGARTIREARVGPVALAGRDAAYGLTSFGVDTISATVVVRRLSDGKQLRSDAATSHPVGPEFTESVDRVVVKSDGAVAWTSTAGSIVRQGVKELEVNRDDRGGHSLLDSGSSVEVTSLRLRGSRLSWRDAGRTRTAALN